VIGLNVLQMNRTVRTDSSTTNVVLDSVDVSDDGLVARSSLASVIGVEDSASPVASAFGSECNQLVSWSAKGMFTNDYTEESVRTLKSLVPIEDDDPSIEDSIALRARSYLHSHCSFCHHPEGTQRTVFDARFLTPLKDSKMVREKARTGYMAVDGKTSEFVIDPGDPERSALFRRLRTSDHELSMPYLGRSVPDQEAIELIGNWIRAMKK